MDSLSNQNEERHPGQWSRQQWLGLLAQSGSDELLSHWQQLDLDPGHRVLREAEIGSVMVRGRIGGEGDAFNLGEMTVTRCSVALDDGTVGHGYIQGRSRKAAMVVALADALLQTDQKPKLAEGLLLPLHEIRQARELELQAKAAATKVDFFTLGRGED